MSGSKAKKRRVQKPTHQIKVMFGGKDMEQRFQAFCDTLNEQVRAKEKMAEEWRAEQAAKSEAHHRYQEQHMEVVERYLEGFNQLVTKLIESKA